MSKFLCLFILLGPNMAQAQAQAQDGQANEETNEEPVPHLVEPSPLFSEGWAWSPVNRSTGPRGAVSALSGLGGETGLLFAVDQSGSVWRSEDDGQRWTLRLSALLEDDEFSSQEEAVLLEAESLAEDLLGGAFEDELDPEALDEEILEEAGRIQEQADTLAVEDWLARQTDNGAGSLPPLVWVHPDFPDLVLLSRKDGLWRSGNGGNDFEQIDPSIQFTKLGWAGGALILGATREGMTYSLDGGRSWIRKSDGVESLKCNDLVWTGTAWLLATDDGLYHSKTGEGWRIIKNGVAGSVVGALVADIGLAGAGWLATDNEVLRFEEDGNRILRFSRQNLSEVHTLISTPRPSHVIAAGADGVWESSDGGYKWRPLARGLKGPEVNALQPLGTGLMLAGPIGIYQLQEYTETKQVKKEIRQVDLDALVHRALHRKGMDPRDYGVRSSFSGIRKLLPELTVDGQLVRRSMLAADYFDLSNQSDIDSDWRISIGLRWGKGGAASDPADNEVSAFGDLFYVLGDRLYSTDNPEALQSATSRLLVDSTDYRLEVRQRLSSLYFAHWRLIRQSAPDGASDLRSAVLFQLDVQELTAWIDAYTEGSFSLALLGE